MLSLATFSLAHINCRSGVFAANFVAVRKSASLSAPACRASCPASSSQWLMHHLNFRAASPGRQKSWTTETDYCIGLAMAQSVAKTSLSAAKPRWEIIARTAPGLGAGRGSEREREAGFSVRDRRAGHVVRTTTQKPRDPHASGVLHPFAQPFRPHHCGT